MPCDLLTTSFESITMLLSRYGRGGICGIPWRPDTVDWARDMEPTWDPDRLTYASGGRRDISIRHMSGRCPEVFLPRKEVIQPHLPVRLPCYDFTPLTLHTFGASPLSVGPATSGADDSGGVTGGVYKARERIHRGMLIRDY